MNRSITEKVEINLSNQTSLDIARPNINAPQLMMTNIEQRSRIWTPYTCGAPLLCGASIIVS